MVDPGPGISTPSDDSHYPLPFENEVPCQGFPHLEETLPSVLLRLCPPDMNGLDREVQGLVEGEWIVGVVIV